MNLKNFHRQSSLERRRLDGKIENEGRMVEGRMGRWVSMDDLQSRVEEAVWLRKMREILFSNSPPTRQSFPTHISQLTDHLFIGNQKNANDLENLHCLGITHVLNCAPSKRRINPLENPYPQEGGLRAYLAIPAEDKEDYDISVHLDRTSTFIDKAKEEEGKVFVHCNMGVNRSGAVVLAYLVTGAHMDFLEAVTVLKKARGVTLTNRAFRKQLVTYARGKGLLKGVPKRSNLGGLKSKVLLRMSSLALSSNESSYDNVDDGEEEEEDGAYDNVTEQESFTKRSSRMQSTVKKEFLDSSEGSFSKTPVRMRHQAISFFTPTLRRCNPVPPEPACRKSSFGGYDNDDEHLCFKKTRNIDEAESVCMQIDDGKVNERNSNNKENIESFSNTSVEVGSEAYRTNKSNNDGADKNDDGLVEDDAVKDSKLTSLAFKKCGFFRGENKEVNTAVNNKSTNGNINNNMIGIVKYTNINNKNNNDKNNNFNKSSKNEGINSDDNEGVEGREKHSELESFPRHSRRFRSEAVKNNSNNKGEEVHNDNMKKGKEENNSKDENLIKKIYEEHKSCEGHADDDDADDADDADDDDDDDDVDDDSTNNENERLKTRSSAKACEIYFIDEKEKSKNNNNRLTSVCDEDNNNNINKNSSIDNNQKIKDQFDNQIKNTTKKTHLANSNHDFSSKQHESNVFGKYKLDDNDFMAAESKRNIENNMSNNFSNQNHQLYIHSHHNQPHHPAEHPLGTQACVLEGGESQAEHNIVNATDLLYLSHQTNSRQANSRQANSRQANTHQVNSHQPIKSNKGSKITENVEKQSENNVFSRNFGSENRVKSFKSLHVNNSDASNNAKPTSNETKDGEADKKLIGKDKPLPWAGKSSSEKVMSSSFVNSIVVDDTLRHRRRTRDNRGGSRGSLVVHGSTFLPDVSPQERVDLLASVAKNSNEFVIAATFTAPTFTTTIANDTCNKNTEDKVVFIHRFNSTKTLNNSNNYHQQSSPWHTHPQQEDFLDSGDFQRKYIETHTDLSNHQLSSHQLSSHQPSSHQPSSHQPSNHQPSSHQPSSHQPSSHQPSSHQLSSHQPSSHQPSSHQPSSHQPSSHPVSSSDNQSLARPTERPLLQNHRQRMYTQHKSSQHLSQQSFSLSHPPLFKKPPQSPSVLKSPQSPPIHEHQRHHFKTETPSFRSQLATTPQLRQRPLQRLRLPHQRPTLQPSRITSEPPTKPKFLEGNQNVFSIPLYFRPSQPVTTTTATVTATVSLGNHTPTTSNSNRPRLIRSYSLKLPSNHSTTNTTTTLASSPQTTMIPQPTLPQAPPRHSKGMRKQYHCLRVIEDPQPAASRDTSLSNAFHNLQAPTDTEKDALIIIGFQPQHLIPGLFPAYGAIKHKK